MLFPKHVFEAEVVQCDYDNGTCVLTPLSGKASSFIKEVPLPHLTGNGSAGIFIGIREGDRVLATYTSGSGREPVVIISFLPESKQYQNQFEKGKPQGTPVGTTPYPEMKPGRISLIGEGGGEVTLDESGGLAMKTSSGAGVHVRKRDSRTATYINSEDVAIYTNGSRLISGPVRRISGLQRNIFPKSDHNTIPLDMDLDYHRVTDSIGLFSGSMPLRKTIAGHKRNPEMAEYRLVINEFAADASFTGFDNEVDRVKNLKSIFGDRKVRSRDREPTNALHLAEYELIEIIGGNVVDINKNVLDINYQPILFGESGGRVPTKDEDLIYEEARLKSRRGIGYHFQLATNAASTDPSTSNTNFVFDIDKEGILKLNVPKSTDTGNIPFVSSANFLGSGDNVDVSYLNPSKAELVPVFLRGEDGEQVIPSAEIQTDVRYTGIRYDNEDSPPYFPSQTSDVPANPIRINPTKHHNIYAAAERLIACTIRRLEIPSVFVDPDNGASAGMPISKPFEILPPTTGEDGEEDPELPHFMSVAIVEPSAPTINPGGDILAAGKLYLDSSQNPDDKPYSNSFSLERNAQGQIVVSEQLNNSSGGKSVNANLEGSLELSIGKDNHDQKSIILDTAGSVIAWFGKDKNNRSLIMQTDGHVLVNVGGTYSGDDPNNQVFNSGRFDLRVNVTDKGFVGTQFNEGELQANGGNPKADSDYIISIGEHGILIAGMKQGKDMIIRNDGKILIESASSDVVLKGNQIKQIDAKGRTKTLKSAGR